MIEHDLGVVFDLADRITVLADGQVIASGPPDRRARQPGRAHRLSRHRRGRAGIASLVAAGGFMLNPPLSWRCRASTPGTARAQVLRGVDLQVGRGEIVAILGRNGAGRSTALKAIMGGVTRSGRVVFAGEDIGRLPPHAIARRGLGYVPEDRSIFPDLTTLQNLVLGEKKGPGGKFALKDAYALFPRLRGARLRPRRRPVRRRAADAGDLPHPDGQPGAGHGR